MVVSDVVGAVVIMHCRSRLYGVIVQRFVGLFVAVDAVDLAVGTLRPTATNKHELVKKTCF